MALNRNDDELKRARLAALTQEGYELISFDGHDLENEIYRFIAFKRNDLLGRGSYGNVYKAYPIDSESGELIKSKKLAVKIFTNTNSVNPAEAKFFDSYYPGCELITAEKNVYMVMPCLPGRSIMENIKRGSLLNVEIQQFDFAQRVALTHNIMLAMHIIHRKTAATGHALIHGDINGTNIKVHYDNGTGQIDVYIVDFGLAEAIEDNPDLVNKAQMIGTPLHMARELYSEKDKEMHGIKSDIYALTPIFAAIFGAVDPFANKTKWNYWQPEYFEATYNFTGIFSGYEIPKNIHFVKEFILKFLSRMQDPAIANRPDSDEALRFFTSLNKLCLIMSVDAQHEDILMCGAQLVVLADGAWKDSKYCSDTLQSEVPAPEHYDFEGPGKASTCAAIMRVAKKTPLNTPILRRIMSKENGMLVRQKSTIFAKQNFSQNVTAEFSEDSADTVLKIKL